MLNGSFLSDLRGVCAGLFSHELKIIQFLASVDPTTGCGIAAKEDRDSTINTDGTTHQEFIMGLQSTVSGSGGIPANINVNYDIQAQNTIKTQNWSLAKLNQQVKELKSQLQDSEKVTPKKKITGKTKQKRVTSKKGPRRPAPAKNKSRKADGEPKRSGSSPSGAGDY